LPPYLDAWLLVIIALLGFFYPYFRQSQAKSNLAKHQISFDEAVSVFDDIHARLIPDP